MKNPTGRKILHGRKYPKILTPLVKRKARHLEKQYNQLYLLWCKTRKVEFLPEGIPFKVSNTNLARISNGLFVLGLNQPLILVSDLLSKSQRIDVARHELNEWKRRSSSNKKNEAHNIAAKMENPKLKKESHITADWYEIEGLNGAKREKLTRADYLKWRKSMTKKFRPTKKR